MHGLGIEAFLAIIEHGSITKAAEMLHLSQSSVSNRLKNLEVELGFKLIERQPGIRGITLTERGHAFVAIAEKSALLEREIENVRNLTRQVTLSIGAADSISQYLLPGLYKALLSECDSIQPQIITQHTLETYESIKSGEIDVGFVKREFDMPNVVVKKIFEEEMILIRYGDHPDYRKTIDPRTLKNSHEIFMDWGYRYQIWHDSIWKKARPMIRVDAAPLIFELLDDERKWTIVPRSVYEALKGKGPFVNQKLLSLPPKRTCYLIYHRSSPSSKIEFIETYCLKHFEALGK